MLLDQIEQDFKDAFKARDEIKKSSLGNVRSALKDAEISKRDKLSEDEVSAVIAKKVKQHRDSITEFAKGGRQDLVDNETAQMQVLEKYLPKQLDESQIRKLVTEAIASTNAQASDFGKVMKQVLSQAKGAADGSIVSRIVKEELK
ncbi:MAG TPA: GatB/YqeY domain-containing protein [Patescibacteria group bacterium]|nr:GatB/YqeY domain-containing protein [Patescibacteria group bacterium]